MSEVWAISSPVSLERAEVVKLLQVSKELLPQRTGLSLD